MQPSDQQDKGSRIEASNSPGRGIGDITAGGFSEQFLNTQKFTPNLAEQALESSRFGLSPTQIFLRNAMIQQMSNTIDSATAEHSVRYEICKQRKDLLRFGTTDYDPEQPLDPFQFRIGDATFSAQNAGLEGFLFTARKLEEHFGKEELLHHLDDFSDYLEEMFSGSPWTEQARQTIAEYTLSTAEPEHKYEYLMSFVTDYTRALRSLVRNADPSFWMHSARIYQFFPRQYNLAERREVLGIDGPDTGKFFADVTREDIRAMKHMGEENGFAFDTFWAMGIYPIGEKGRLGTDGGSPFAIKDYLAISPEFGTPADFARFVKICHEEDVRVMIDFVPNHTSMDSVLLMEDPTYFIHRVANDDQEPVPEGHFEVRKGDTRYFVSHGAFDNDGTVSYFRDTAQLDYTNPRTRKKMIEVVNRLVDLYQVDGFRNDMAYGITNEYFGRNHRCEEQLAGQPEFLKELFDSVKERHPHVATTNEGYDLWDQMSRCGCDSIYGKNDMQRAGGYNHTGYYDALVSRDPEKLKESLVRAEFLLWQTGGASALMFDGNHDEPSPIRQFGEDHWRGAALLTMMLPGSTLVQAGQEIGNDQAEPELEKDSKPLPFRKESRLSWSNPREDVVAFYDEVKALAGHIHGTLQLDRMRVHHERFSESAKWVGYQLTDQNLENAGFAVIWNPTGEIVDCKIESRLGKEPVNINQPLAPGECAVISLVTGRAVFSWS